MTAMYSKMTHTWRVSKTEACQAALMRVEYWITPYGIPDFPLRDNSPQLARKFLTLFAAPHGWTTDDYSVLSANKLSNCQRSGTAKH